MRSIGKHLTFANVVSTMGVFLLLAGGTAFAANQLAKKSVGAKQLKNNAVTTAKIKKAAVTRAKLAANAVTTSQLADGSVTTSKIPDGAITGAKINAGSTAFSQRVARVQSSTEISFSPGSFKIGSYTQQPGEDNQYLPGLDILFPASCSPPRTAVAQLLIDPVDPSAPTPFEISGFAVLVDQTAGTATRRMDFSSFPGGFGSLTRVAPLTPTTHSFYVKMEGANCSGGGSGVAITNSQIDVIGTK